MDVLIRYRANPDDPEAREAMYQKYRRFLYRLAAPFAECDSAIDADDLVQEGYFALLEAAEGYDMDSHKPFTAWAGWFVKRKYYQALGAHTVTCEDGKRRYRIQPRAASLDAPVTDDGELSLCDTIEDTAAIDPEEWAINKGLGPLLESCVDKLPPAKAQVIRLCYLQGHTLKDAAEIMGMSYAAAWAAQGEALRLLRRMRDIRLLEGDGGSYYRGKSVAAFQRTHMSITEEIAFKRIGGGT